VAKVVAAAWQANGREAGEEALRAYYSERGLTARTATEVEVILGIARRRVAEAATAIGMAVREDAAGSVGSRTLKDLPSGDPPPQLCDPYLSAEGVTVVYGLGGVGKGYVSVYLILQLVRQGKRVTVIDFENHPGEWGRRARTLGFTDDELQMVNYRAPFADDWTAKRGALATVAEILREDLDAATCDYLVIDSYTTATATGSELGGMGPAQEFFGGIAKLGRPALVIAHVASGGDKFPDKPFGTVFVHNLARETWAVGRVGEADDGGPMTLELRNKKSNGRAKSKPQFLTFTFDAEGRVSVDDHKPMEASRANLAADVLSRSIKQLTVKDLAAAIKADTGETISPENLRRDLRAHPERFEETNDAPHQWGLFGKLYLKVL
jgi:hypothetical protein